MEPRLYQSEADLEAMRSLLVAGRQSANGTYYVHSGDLLWWYFYHLAENDPRPHTYLWYNQGGELDGWALSNVGWRGTMDVFVRPALRGTPQGNDMLAWAVQKFSLAGPEGQAALADLWIAEDDGWMDERLRHHGFERTERYMWVMQQEMDEPLLAPSLPPGFSVRQVRGELDVRLRAAVQAAAFESNMDFETYMARFTRFMRSPAYAQGIDLMVLAPDEEAAAFCIVWPDPVNQVGLFEPVGTHPSFQRMGLGRAVTAEGLRRLQACGMRRALVCCEEENRAFYEAAGFRRQKRLYTYELRR